jgi:NAD/NADP transhydrogenase alpha subunit
MKTVTKILAATMLSLTLLCTGESAMAKTSHKRTTASHTKKHVKKAKHSAKKKKSKHSASLPHKRTGGYAKASSYMSSRKPASVHKKHSKKTSAKKKHHKTY